MYNRLKTTNKPQILTKPIVDDIYQILNETFEDDLDKTLYQFYIHGEIYETETVLVICLINQESEIDAITCILSCDQSNKRQKNDIDQLIDFYGEVFEQITQNSFKNIEFNPNWQQHPTDDRIYFQLSRENIILSLKADKLLEQ